jgi:hypothetical protein
MNAVSRAGINFEASEKYLVARLDFLNKRGGRDMVGVALVRSDANAQRLYVHEVALTEKFLQSPFKIGADTQPGMERSAADAGAIRNVVSHAFGVNIDEDPKATASAVAHDAHADMDAVDAPKPKASTPTEKAGCRRQTCATPLRAGAMARWSRV